MGFRTAHVGPSYTSVNKSSWPSVLQQNSTCDINERLTNRLVSEVGIGWDNDAGPPNWLEEICPEVVDHFNRFPSFKEYPSFFSREIPLQSTAFAAQAVCTAKVVNWLAASINARVYLHAGSHLGAILHGQPMPWDDDSDMWMDFNKMKPFLEACDRFGGKVPLMTKPSRVELHCHKAFNAIKVWLQYDGMKKQTSSSREWRSPFIDFFLFKITPNRIQEVNPNGKKRAIWFNIRDYFPTQPFYFGGIYLMGPPPRISESRYKVQNCVMGLWNHRIESRIAQNKTDFNGCLDCRKLHKVFPFVYDSTTIKVYGRDEEQKLYPAIGSVFRPLVTASIEQRKQWYNAQPAQAQNITDQIPNLNSVEIDNSISPSDECHGRRLKVVEFNMQRGKRWLESAGYLKDADVVILNEMDIGMARSDQQHTTRLLAYYLGMNYAWGLEFIELTLGDKGDRETIYSTEHNFYGLHGNAILSKCKFSNATIFRNPVGRYFSHDKSFVNAFGSERRLGGRMILLARINVNGTSVVVGSSHKLGGFRSRHVRNYIKDSPAVIAGDEGPGLCKQVGLRLIQSHAKHFTWPASCNSFGKARGDNICSNMKVMEEEYTLKPCVRTKYDINISLGDHAITGAVFDVAIVRNVSIA